MNYESMSDFEINKAVFPLTRNYGKCEDVMAQKNPDRGALMWGDGANWFKFDACNNHNDMWPIIVDNGISTINLKGTTQWFACSQVEFETICMSPDGSDNGISAFYTKYEYHNTNPLRAAAIVFLMMQEEK